jgi:hypothetical protein
MERSFSFTRAEACISISFVCIDNGTFSRIFLKWLQEIVLRLRCILLCYFHLFRNSEVSIVLFHFHLFWMITYSLKALEIISFLRLTQVIHLRLPLEVMAVHDLVLRKWASMSQLER